MARLNKFHDELELIVQLPVSADLLSKVLDGIAFACPDSVVRMDDEIESLVIVVSREKER